MDDEVLLGVATPAGCEASAWRCSCQGGHRPDSAHSCDCGGSWRGDGDTFEVVALPRVPVADFAAALVDIVASSGVRRGGIRWPIPGEEPSDG